MTDDLAERVADAIWMADAEPVDPSERIPFAEAWESQKAQCRAEARAALAVALEEAAKVCDGIEDAEWKKWKQHADMMAQGASCGASECAAAIRALIKKEEGK